MAANLNSGSPSSRNLLAPIVPEDTDEREKTDLKTGVVCVKRGVRSEIEREVKEKSER